MEELLDGRAHFDGWSHLWLRHGSDLWLPFEMVKYDVHVNKCIRLMIFHRGEIIIFGEARLVLAWVGMPKASCEEDLRLAPVQRRDLGRWLGIQGNDPWSQTSQLPKGP